MAGGGLLIGYLGLRFKRAAGIPIVVILSVSIAFAILVIHPWYSVSPSQPEAGLRILAIGGGKQSVEFSEIDKGPVFFELESGRLEVIVELLETADYYFFVSRPFMYRFIRLVKTGTYSGSTTETRPDLSTFQMRIQAFAERLPGWGTRTIAVEAPRLVPLFSYSINLDGPDGPAITLGR